jgi:hypothetical protein
MPGAGTRDCSRNRSVRRRFGSSTRCDYWASRGSPRAFGPDMGSIVFGEEVTMEKDRRGGGKIRQAGSCMIDENILRSTCKPEDQIKWTGHTTILQSKSQTAKQLAIEDRISRSILESRSETVNPR